MQFNVVYQVNIFEDKKLVNTYEEEQLTNAFEISNQDFLSPLEKKIDHQSFQRIIRDMGVKSKTEVYVLELNSLKEAET